MTSNHASDHSAHLSDLGHSLRWAMKVSEIARSSHEWEESLALISPQERKYVRSQGAVQDQQRSLLGRLMLRRAASSVMGMHISEVDFQRTREGKPYVKAHGFPGLNLNVSHHGDWVFMGMTMHGIIGVDVASTGAPREGLRADAYLESFAAYFSEEERKTMRSGTTEEDKFFAFAVMWALKESFVKAVGTGMAFGLHRLELSVNPRLLDPAWWASVGSGPLQREGVQVRVDGKLRKEWEFELGVLGSGAVPPYVVATAVGPFAKASLASRAAMELPGLTRRVSAQDSCDAFNSVAVISHSELLPLESRVAAPHQEAAPAAKPRGRMAELKRFAQNRALIRGNGRLVQTPSC